MRWLCWLAAACSVLWGGEAAFIKVAGGSPQVVGIGEKLKAPLRVAVTDADGKGLKSRVVTFTAPAAGAGGLFQGKAVAKVSTDATGIATASSFTANGTPGNYVMTATVDGAMEKADFAVTNAAPGAPSLGGSFKGKTGALNARVWSIEVGNRGPGSALGAEIRELKLEQTKGTACAPVVRSAMPVAAGNIAPGAVAEVGVAIDFGSCAVGSVFKATAVVGAGDSASGSIVRMNQFP